MVMRVLVVGAGFTGATLAERIAAGGREVLVIDRHRYVGGAAHDYVEDGITVQAHGPHVFHTNSERVWSYIAKFGRWNAVQYRVAAEVDERLVPLPVGFFGVRQLLGEKLAAKTIAELSMRYRLGSRVTIEELRRSRMAPELVERVTESILRGYSEKHWGMPLEEVPASVTSRLPIIIGDQPSYFSDRYQMVPSGGYTSVITRMLAHPRIKLELGVDYKTMKPRDSAVFYTGSPDEFFGEAGVLPYRTVRFEEQRFPHHDHVHDYATVTYPHARWAFTRRTDVGLITGRHPKDNVIVTEYPSAHVPGETEPLYPVPTGVNITLRQGYSEPDKVWFAGRLGSYQYLNMDQAVAQALALYERVKGEL